MSCGSWNFVSNVYFLNTVALISEGQNFHFDFFGCFCLLCFRELLEAQNQFTSLLFQNVWFMEHFTKILKYITYLLFLWNTNQTPWYKSTYLNDKVNRIQKTIWYNFFCHVFNHDQTDWCCQLLRNKSVLLFNFQTLYVNKIHEAAGWETAINMNMLPTLCWPCIQHIFRNWFKGYISVYNRVIALQINGNGVKGFNINFIWLSERSKNNI